MWTHRIGDILKTELSSLEIRVLTDELKCLIGGRIQKVFQENKTVQLLMHVPGLGTKTLIIGNGKIFLTKYRLKHSQVPTSFAMYLRKYCKGHRIRNIYQHDFERIVIIEMDEYNLIIELFSKGNVIFTDKDNSIWSVLERQFWSSRKIKQREEYRFPPQGINPILLTADVLEKSLNHSEKQIIAFLARDLSIGGTFAEEVCHLAKIDKNRMCNTLTKKDSKMILKSISKVLAMIKRPQIVIHKDEEIDVLPFDVVKYKGFEKKYYDNYFDAVDDYFVKKMAELEETVQNKDVKVKKDKLTKRYDNQKSAIDKLKIDEKDSVKKAELIYEHYQAFEKLITAIEKSGGIANAKKIAKEVTDIDLKTKTITVNVKGVKIELYTHMNLNENANTYFDRAKKMREKIKSATEALAVTVKKMGEAKEIVLKKVNIEKKVESRKWFHKFRWFVSSSGFLIVGGKDATSNEVLVKKHVEEQDIIFHTDITGSPFVVLKTEGKNIDAKTLDETAQFVGIYSRAWKANVGIAEVYHITPKQVSKKAPSGEYINKGSFMIYGKKNIMKVELKFGIGFKDNELVLGPKKAVTSITKKYVVIGPGNEKSTVLAKKIKAELFSKCNKEEQEHLRKINTDAIAKAIPFGTGQLIR